MEGLKLNKDLTAMDAKGATKQGRQETFLVSPVAIERIDWSREPKAKSQEPKAKGSFFCFY